MNLKDFDCKKYYDIIEENIHLFSGDYRYQRVKLFRFNYMIRVFQNNTVNFRFRKSIYNCKTKVLDIGFGDGELILLLSKKGFDVSGIDISEHKKDRLKELLNNSNLNANLSVGSIYEIGKIYNKSKFDGIFLSEVLEHLAKPIDAIKEIFKVLKKDGKLIITVPFEEKIQYYVCINCYKLTTASGHLNSYSINSLKRILEESGFSIELARPVINRLFKIKIISGLMKLPFLSFIVFIDRLLNSILKKPSFILVLAKK
jgi:2-polyprenyl-3-methyl-5-hydroxy-6-metoxy-1,4-benzoquinol methylase